MNRYKRTAYLIGASIALVLSGCANLGLGGSGASSSDGSNDDGPVVTGFKVYEVFYATNRQSTGTQNPHDYFGVRRGPMAYGIASVSVPNLRSTLVAEKSIIDTPSKYNPDKDFTIQRLDPLVAPAFFDKVRAATAGAKPQDVLVYVHGYLNSFRDALFRAAQLKHDLEFPGLAVAYSWPSQGTAAGYTLDEANVEWSAHHFREFLKELTARAGQARVHIIAHSMGNRMLAAALQNLACERGAGKLHHLILAAPDIDAEVFRRDVAPMLRLTAVRVTLYVSEDDKALMASRLVHGYERAGEARIVTPHIDTVDTSGLGAKWFEPFHSYFAEAKRVLLDIKKLLLQDAKPADRELKQRTTPDGAYWAFN